MVQNFLKLVPASNRLHFHLMEYKRMFILCVKYIRLCSQRLTVLILHIGESFDYIEVDFVSTKHVVRNG